MRAQQQNIGLYVHIPFCRSKCPYCDFYSLTDLSASEAYAGAVIRTLGQFGREYPAAADTLYFGGGTPSLLEPGLICDIISAAKDNFKLKNAEITCEANPETLCKEKISALARGGVNRLSIGLQSADNEELKRLGRTHDSEDAERAVLAARDAGIKNISLDLIIGLPDQTEKDVEKSVDFCAGLDVQHVSAYILKIEPESAFGIMSPPFTLPGDDAVSQLYLSTCRLLEERGYVQYEISNFAKTGFESRHNLKYWRCEEYLGVGASAHSFIGGKRFFYDRDISGFIKGMPPRPDGEGGGFEEYVMLGLRLSEGIRESQAQMRFSRGFSDNMKRQAELCVKNGLAVMKGDNIALTQRGFLVSNLIISRMLDEK